MTDVDLRKLKSGALSFPEPTRSLILSEPDIIDSKELISKLATWDRLLKMQKEVRT